MSEYVDVKIPVDLYNAAADIVLQTEQYTTVSEIVCHILREFAPGHREGAYSPKQQQELKKRLQDLGYLG